jgi:hypothetical protein
MRLTVVKVYSIEFTAKIKVSIFTHLTLLYTWNGSRCRSKFLICCRYLREVSLKKKSAKLKPLILRYSVLKFELCRIILLMVQYQGHLKTKHYVVRFGAVSEMRSTWNLWHGLCSIRAIRWCWRHCAICYRSTWPEVGGRGLCAIRAHSPRCARELKFKLYTHKYMHNKVPSHLLQFLPGLWDIRVQSLNI